MIKVTQGGMARLICVTQIQASKIETGSIC